MIADPLPTFYHLKEYCHTAQILEQSFNNSWIPQHVDIYMGVLLTETHNAVTCCCSVTSCDFFIRTVCSLCMTFVSLNSIGIKNINMCNGVTIGASAACEQTMNYDKLIKNKINNVFDCKIKKNIPIFSANLHYS